MATKKRNHVQNHLWSQGNYIIRRQRDKRSSQLPQGTSLSQYSTEFAFTYIFAAHGDRQVGHFWGGTDPEEKPAAHLHHMKMYNLLQNLLRKIVHRDAFTRRVLFEPIHFVKLLLSLANKLVLSVNRTVTSGFVIVIRPKQQNTMCFDESIVQMSYTDRIYQFLGNNGDVIFFI